MFALLALIAAVIGALAAFAGLNISVTGMICVALACLAAHLLRPWTPWT
jgi:hypothetical protein